MPRYELTPVWNQSSGGWSESYITGVVSDPNLAPIAQSLVSLRSNLLFAAYHDWLGLRVSKLPVDPNTPESRRESRVYLVGASEMDTGGKLVIPGVGSRTELSGAIETPDQLNACLQLRVKYGDTRSTIRYLAGIPDGISAAEPIVMNQQRNGDWWQRLDAFRQFVVAQFYVLALANTGNYAPVDARKLTLAGAAPAMLVVSVDTATAKPITAGDKVLLSGFRRKKDKPGASLNGTFYVDAVSTTLFSGFTSYTIRGTEGNDPGDWKILGKVRKKGYEYSSIQRLDPYRVRTHQRGRPFLAPRGRRTTRLSLDP